MKRRTRPGRSVPAFIGALIVFSIMAGLLLKTSKTAPYPVQFVYSNSQSPIDEQLPDAPEVDPELAALHRMVSQTRGFYARDYSLWLGWNNVRPWFPSEQYRS